MVNKDTINLCRHDYPYLFRAEYWIECNARHQVLRVPKPVFYLIKWWYGLSMQVQNH